MATCQENQDKYDSLIIDSFLDFIVNHELIQKDEINDLIDDTIRLYIINTIKQFYDDYESHLLWIDSNTAKDQFEIEQFMEVVDAYLPSFINLDKNNVIKWLIELKRQIDSLFNEEKSKNSSEIIIENNCEKSTITNSKIKNKSPNKKKKNMNSKFNEAEYKDDFNLQPIIEMFPHLKPKIIIKKYLHQFKDTTKTIDELLKINSDYQESSSQSESELSSDSEVADKLNDQLLLTEEEKKIIKEKTIEK